MTQPGTTDWLPPYDGNDMIGYMLERGFKFPDKYGAILSMTNIRDTAIIITDYAIWKVSPCRQIGFCLELMQVL